MPDTKITALAAITTVAPANDLFPIVDVSDNSMAASGTTKNITVNQLLGAGGTATLASATITGALTAGTDITITNGKFATSASGQTVGLQLDSFVSGGAFNNYILNNASAAGTLASINFGRLTSLLYGFIRTNNSSQNLQLGTSGATGSVEFLLNNSTAMTLNSTGLGVGVTPASGDGSGVFKAAGTGSLTANSRVGLDVRELVSGNSAGIILGAMTTENTAVIGSRTASGNIAFQTYNGSSWGERMRIDYLGNVGVGVTPSAKFDVGLAGAGTPRFRVNNVGDDPVAEWQRFTGTASNFYGYRIVGGFGSFEFQNSNQAAIGSQTFTTRMTLDASGNLLIGTTTPSSLIGGSGAITARGIAGILSVNVTALSTNFTLPIGAFSGILVIRSNGGGGSAVWMLDPNAGAVSISNNIAGRTITFTFSGGAWQLQQTVGTVPSLYNYNVIATQ